MYKDDGDKLHAALQKPVRMAKLPPFYKQCKKCDKVFRTSGGNHAYCIDCTSVTCKECKTEFKVKGATVSRYCSRECSVVGQKGKKKGPYKVNKEAQARASDTLRKRYQGVDREELIEKVSSLTREAMQRPDVQEKIRAKRRPLTAAHKAKISAALGGKTPSNYHDIIKENKYSSKFGWLELGGQRHYMRSSWERNIARYLEWLKEQGQIKGWDYECHRFIFEQIQFGNRTYLPDFKVFENDGSYYWIEVKGYMTKASVTKLRRMQKYYPEEKIQLLDSDQYQSLRKDLRYLIDGWE